MEARHELRSRLDILHAQVEVGEKRLAKTCQALIAATRRGLQVSRVAV